jgi:hypothetical protein
MSATFPGPLSNSGTTIAMWGPNLRRNLSLLLVIKVR